MTRAREEETSEFREREEIIDECTGNKSEKSEQKSATDWRKLFSPAGDQTLKFYPLEKSEGKLRVALPEEVIEEGEMLWKNAVVAQFVGRIPNFSMFQKQVNMFWGQEGEMDIRPAGLNLFIIQFPNCATRERVLENGPWHIQNKPLIVRKWEPGMRSWSLTWPDYQFGYI